MSRPNNNKCSEVKLHMYIDTWYTFEVPSNKCSYFWCECSVRYDHAGCMIIQEYRAAIRFLILKQCWTRLQYCVKISHLIVLTCTNIGISNVVATSIPDRLQSTIDCDILSQMEIVFLDTCITMTIKICVWSLKKKIKSKNKQKQTKIYRLPINIHRRNFFSSRNSLRHLYFVRTLMSDAILSDCYSTAICNKCLLTWRFNIYCQISNVYL